MIIRNFCILHCSIFFLYSLIAKAQGQLSCYVSILIHLLQRVCVGGDHKLKLRFIREQNEATFIDNAVDFPTENANRLDTFLTLRSFSQRFSGIFYKYRQ